MKVEEMFKGVENLFVELLEPFLRKQHPKLLEVWHRRQIFTAPVTALIFVCQKLDKRNSLSAALDVIRKSKSGGALDRLLDGSRRIAFEEVNVSVSGACQARTRLSEATAKTFFEEINAGLIRMNRRVSGGVAGSRRLWSLLDGSTIGLRNTAAIKKEFPALSNQKAEECQPCARVVFAHNLFDAVAERPAIGSMMESEQSLAYKVIETLKPESGIIADRNFGVFSINYYAQQRKVKTLVRMTEARANKLIGKERIQREGVYEVEWTPSKKDRTTTSSIPEDAHISGKLLVTTVNNPGFKSERIYLFTTDMGLTEEQAMELYKERWRIENDIRTLKHTVNLDIVYSETPEMVRKEILFGIIAYNMIRSLILNGAIKNNLAPREISFTRAVGAINMLAYRLATTETPLKADFAIQAFYREIRTARHPKRKNPRVEPRALVRTRRTRFPSLKGSRQDARNKIISNLG